MTADKHGDTGALSGKVSIIVPAYNAAGTIESAIRSALEQEYGNLELIVCDDASTDDTWARLIAMDDKRLLLLRNEHNLGPGATRERALAAATGRWVAFLDADDQWAPQRLETLTQAAGEDPNIVVFDDIMECVSRTDGLIPWRRQRGERAFAARGRICDVPASAWAASPRLLIKPLVARALLEQTAVRQCKRPYGEDSEYVFRLLAAGAALRYVPRPLYLYRVMESSISSSRTRHMHMLDMLGEMKVLFAGSPDIGRAIDVRYRFEVRQERYFRFLWACRSRHLGQAAWMVICYPWIVLAFLRRLVVEAPIRLRKLHWVVGRMNK